MKIKVKAITSVMHGRHHLQAGNELEVTKTEAEELQKVGLVQLVDEQEAPAQDQDQGQNRNEDHDVSDLLGGDDGGAKMEEQPANKMDAAPDNKSSDAKHHRKTTAKKAE